jgi:molybdenum cofactor biosynthesis protein A
MIYDNHQRPITYLRLAVTDRCNLRCFYCMPEEGIAYLPKKQLLSYEEMWRLCHTLGQLGVSKIRITGGEPFVRQGLLDFMAKIAELPTTQELTLTTNGVLTQAHLPALWHMGVRSINLSLDTLDRQRFFDITRRDEFEKVWNCLLAMIDWGFEVKINAVVMEGKNTDDILPLVALTEQQNVSVRFIEEMPFNGDNAHYTQLPWDFRRIVGHIQAAYPSLQKINDGPFSTSYNYQIPGHRGTVGVIAAFSRTFCGTCNRIRVTAQGDLKTCLYDQGVLNLRDLMRAGATDEELTQHLLGAFSKRPKDGFEAERQPSLVRESMSTIGG